jgi:hypothetical protein
VWRPAYADVPAYLFDFLDTRDPRPRIAYAASFGTDAPEFTPALHERSRPLAQRLSAVSVRESSGVDLARELWDVEALHVVDPVMLLEPERLAELTDGAEDAVPAGRMIDYVLDDTSAARAVVARVGEVLDDEPLSLLSRRSAAYRDYRRRPADFARPSVEAWLDGIRRARFLVTDSFHGAVCAILFHVPFIVVVNRRRGAARFVSLLSMFGLEHRMVESADEVTAALVEAPIDWDDVDARVEHERRRGRLFLANALGGEPASADQEG